MEILYLFRNKAKAFVFHVFLNVFHSFFGKT